jgi:hypothetical protein
MTAMPELETRPFFPSYDEGALHCNVQKANPPPGGRAPECGKTPAWPVETLCETCRSTGENNMCAECLEVPLYCAQCWRLNALMAQLTVFRM